MKIACYVMTALFGLFTYLQFNDLGQYGTDLWYGWVVFYAAVALVSLVSAFRPLPRPVLLVATLATLAAAIYRSTGIEWEQTVLYNENNPSGNETGGLLLVVVWLAVLCWKRSAPATA